MDALEKLGWLKTPNGDGFLYVKDDRVLSIHKNHLRVWDDFGDACYLNFIDVFALSEVLRNILVASK